MRHCAACHVNWQLHVKTNVATNSNTRRSRIFFIISGVFSGHWLWGVQGGFAVGARESLESGRPRTTLG